MGPVELQRPTLRGTDEAFCSRHFGAGVTRTNARDSLVISGWAWGLSDRERVGGRNRAEPTTASPAAFPLSDGTFDLSPPAEPPILRARQT